nr:hypothetical protein Iba_chr13aCG9380 [Ipomoea batatas]
MALAVDPLPLGSSGALRRHGLPRCSSPFGEQPWWPPLLPALNSGKFSVDASQAGGSSPSSNVHNIKRWRQLCLGNVFAPTAGGLSTGSPPPGGIKTTFIDCAALSSDATSEGVLVLLGSVLPLQSLVADIDDYEIGNCLTSFSILARAMAWLWDVMDREETVVDNVSILSNSGALSTGYPPPGGIRTTFIDCAALSSDATSEGVLVLLGSVPPLQSLVADIDDYEIGNCLTSFSRLARAMAWLWDVMDREETVVDNVSILSNSGGLSTGYPPPGGIRTTFIDCAALSSDATSEGVAMQVPTTTAVSLTIESELRVVFVGGFVGGNCAFEGPSAPGFCATIADNCFTSFSRLARAMAWLWDVMDREETVVDNVSILSNCNSKALTDFCKALMADSVLNSGKFSVDASQAGGSSPSSNVHNIKRWRQLCLGNVFAPTAGALSTGSPPPGGIKTTFIDCAALSSDATSEGVLVLLGSVPPLQSLVADIDDYEIGNCLTSFSRLARAMAWLWDVMDREETVVDNVSILSNCNSKALTDFYKALMADSVLNSGKFSVDASQAGGSSPSSNVHNIKRWRQLCLGNVFAPTAGGLSTGSPPPGGIKTTFIDCAALSSDATSEGVAMQVPTTTAVSLTIESELRVVFVGGFVGGNCAFEGPSAPGLCATIAESCC